MNLQPVDTLKTQWIFDVNSFWTSIFWIILDVFDPSKIYKKLSLFKFVINITYNNINTT